MAEQRGGRPTGGGERGRRPAQSGGPRGAGSGGGRSGGSSSSSSSSPRGGSSSGATRGDRRDDRRGDRRDDRKPYSPKGKDERRGGFRDDRPRRTPEQRTAEQAVYDGPPIPEEVTGKELDRSVTAQLRGMPEKLASRVARHLAAAGLLIDDDPETAYQHTLAARARAQRLAVVREACGEAAYAAGHYAEALSELRAAKRMNGATAYLPIMADCHRALGHPEQALKLAKSPSVANFPAEAKAEMTIVESGARRDMGQLDAALRVLELAPLMHKTRDAWVVRLRYAYADTLVAAGRGSDALEWFHRTHAIDSEELTDAAQRAAELERTLGD